MCLCSDSAISYFRFIDRNPSPSTFLKEDLQILLPGELNGWRRATPSPAQSPLYFTAPSLSVFKVSTDLKSVQEDVDDDIPTCLHVYKNIFFRAQSARGSRILSTRNPNGGGWGRGEGFQGSWASFKQISKPNIYKIPNIPNITRYIQSWQHMRAHGTVPLITPWRNPLIIPPLPEEPSLVPKSLSLTWNPSFACGATPVHSGPRLLVNWPPPSPFPPHSPSPLPNGSPFQLCDLLRRHHNLDFI